MTPHRPLSEHEYAALSLLLHGAPIVFSDVPARNGTDVIGGPIPGRKTWQSLINAGLVLDPTEDPIQLDDGELFSFTVCDGPAPLIWRLRSAAMVRSGGCW